MTFQKVAAFERNCSGRLPATPSLLVTPTPWTNNGFILVHEQPLPHDSSTPALSLDYERSSMHLSPRIIHRLYLRASRPFGHSLPLSLTIALNRGYSVFVSLVEKQLQMKYCVVFELVGFFNYKSRWQTWRIFVRAKFGKTLSTHLVQKLLSLVLGSFLGNLPLDSISISKLHGT